MVRAGGEGQSMRRRGGIALALALASVVAIFVVAASSSCSSSNGAVGLDDSCTINSDCNSPLICAFARCHEACAASRDCPNSERCVLSGAIGICQLPQESTCAGDGATCQSGQVCGTDAQCRAQCTGTSDCASGDICLPTGAVSACYAPSNAADEAALVAAGALSPDGAVLFDGSPGNGSDGSSSSGTDGATSSDGSMATSSDGQADGPTGPPCLVTQFTSTAIGDSNQYFTSGVGARTTNELLVFDSYVGPDPTGDGGGPSIAAIYDQAFDPVSGNSAGPAQPLVTMKNQDIVGRDSSAGMMIESAAIAPTGQIALVCSVRFYITGGSYDSTQLYAVFLGVGGDGGAGLTVQRTALLSTAAFYQQPYAIWSTTSNAFVFSWYDGDGGDFVTVQKFQANGSPAGGNSTVVPTVSSNNTVYSNHGVAQGAAGESNGLLGVAYEAPISSIFSLTILDATGALIGSPFSVAHPVSGTPLWTAVGGTAQGFVYFYDEGGGVGEVFLPVGGDAGVVGAGSDASTFTGFSFPGTVHATAARALSDSAGGAGGVGLALLYPTGVSFAYVQADGVHHVGPSPILPHTVASGDYTSLTTLNGSFVTSLYSSANHQTQVAASGSGCTP